MTIKQLIKHPQVRLRSIRPDAPVADAITMLAADDTSALLVTGNGKSMDGILSSSDIVKYLDDKKTVPASLLVLDVMTKDVLSCDVKENVQRLEQLMTQNNVRHIPITDNSVPIALVSIIDVTRHRLSQAEGEMYQMREFVSGPV